MFRFRRFIIAAYRHRHRRPNKLRLLFGGTTAATSMVLYSTSDETVVEPYTNHVYENSSCFWFQSDNDTTIRRHLDLGGTSIRCMMDLCFLRKARAYSIALYYDANAYKAALYNQITNNNDNNNNNNDDDDDNLFEKMILNDQLFSKAIRIVFNNEISGSHLAKGFEKAMNSRLKHYKFDEENEEETRANIRKFIQETKMNVKPNDEMIFSWEAKTNMLLISINGVAVSFINDSFVCWALFDYYFGEKPISTSLKHDIETQWYQNTKTSPNVYNFLQNKMKSL